MASEQELEQRVQQLAELVHKQSEMIAKTGKQVMEMQLSDVKTRMASMDNTPQKFNPEDYASNEDIVQLVGELQGQLDYMESRSIARTYNSHLTQDSASAEKVAPLCNKDGEEPPEYFPRTIGQLNEIDDADLLRLCEFYDLVIEDDANLELAAIVKSEELTPEDAQKLVGTSSSKLSLEQKLQSFSSDDLADLFDDFARFIGVRVRRGSSW